jgi:hypothetical protein
MTVDVARHGHAMLMTSSFERVSVKKWIRWISTKVAAQASSAEDKVRGSLVELVEPRLLVELAFTVRQN